MEKSDKAKRPNSQKDDSPETEEGEDLKLLLSQDPLPGLPFGVKVITLNGTYVKGSLRKQT